MATPRSQADWDALLEAEGLGVIAAGEQQPTLLATPRQAELANLRRANLRVDQNGYVAKQYRRTLTAQQKGANLRAKRAGMPIPHSTNPYLDDIEVSSEPLVYATPKPQFYLGEIVAEHASADAGNGPLAWVGPQGPQKLEAGHDEVKASPVVGTEGYHPGRSPWQLARFAVRNQDITTLG